MSVKNKALPIPLSSIDSATFTGAYQLISGAAGITNPCITLRIVNASNIGVTVSFDGTNDHGFVRAGSDWEMVFQSNSMPQNQVCCMAQFTKIYVKAAAGAGLVYLSGFFQPLGA